MGKQLVKRWTQEEDKFIKDNYLKMTDDEIGDNIGRTSSAVKSERQKLNLYRPRKKRLINNKSMKITFSEVKESFENSKYILLSDESEYKNQSSKLRYLCPDHLDKGELKISFGHFKKGEGCYYCGRERTNLSHKTKQTDFDDKQLCIEKGFEYISTEKRNDGYYYINFICNNHRYLGIQSMRRGNMNRNSVKGCQYCIGRNLPSWYVKQEIESRYPDFKVISEFNGMNNELECYCKKHHEYFAHEAKRIYYDGRGCKQCSSERKSEAFKLSEKEIRERVYKANPDIKIVSFNDYTCTYSYIKVRCKKCGFEWESPIASLFVNGTRCPVCNSGSKGEAKIIEILEKYNIPFSPQYTFDDCKYKRVLPFDNSILNNQGKLLGLIEYQGEQHYSPIGYFGGEEKFKTTQKRDKIKKNYCVLNNIPLLIIPYWKFDNIESIILDFLDQLNLNVNDKVLL